MNLSGISVFLPCYNEEGNVERVVSALAPELAKLAERFEIVVVDDGSADRTGEIADALALAHSYVKVVHHPQNQGYGAAVTSGIRACTEPWVVLCDGDGQFEASDIAKLTAKIPAYDVVIGRRVQRADPLMRRIKGKAWTLLMRLLLRLPVSDMDCGLKLFKREVIEKVKLEARGAMISAEIMAQVVRGGANICEVEVNHLPRLAGEQTGANPRVVLKAFKELFLLYGRLRRQT
ncbi:MAG: glycosyltransferase family 2 protein [Candidatus Binataceae bacterium]